MRTLDVLYDGDILGAFPDQTAKNATTETAFDGTPYKKDNIDDLTIGWLQALFFQTGAAIPNGQPEVKDNSQILDLMREAFSLPVGATYIQFPGDDNPTTLGLLGTWSNVSSELAGDFIRLEGGSASAFEAGQQLDQFQGHYIGIDAGNTLGDGTNPQFRTSTNVNTVNLETGQAIISDGVNGTPRIGPETRPVNRTVRKWRRIS